MTDAGQYIIIQGIIPDIMCRASESRLTVVAAGEVTVRISVLRIRTEPHRPSAVSAFHQAGEHLRSSVPLFPSAAGNLLLHLFKDFFNDNRFVSVFDPIPFLHRFADFLCVLVGNVGLLMLDGALFPAPKMMTVIAIEPGMKPYVQSIQNGLESLQREVGGDIQAVYPYADPVAIIAAEEGKLMGMPFNRALRDEDGHIYDFLVGKFLIVGLGEDKFTSVPDELIPKYKEVFKTPEMLLQIGGRICIVPIDEPKKKSSVLKKLNEPHETNHAPKPKPKSHSKEVR